MARSLERLAYRSRATVSVDSLLLIADVLAVSQRNNRRDGVSGALTYSDGVFFQVVEGYPEDLDRLLRRLSEDPRHSAITIVHRAPVAGRLFGEWSMTAPRIAPDLAPAMKKAVEESDIAPSLAIETLRRLATASPQAD
ncbi:BLUF domain-containing protein [Brevundimonas goettingensis]|uniref:BLUF domain-containing protein n=1 Tax=Brevundimonas goettingensis TaxID=2774190 RepID=A0A975GXE6_9CAUL|nr:BLUF domain-containing protein [Brevundimonas goettingensis]QTC92799.1 BLUF domain-containing protein [Brevundimonas goettingensis]